MAIAFGVAQFGGLLQELFLAQVFKTNICNTFVGGFVRIVILIQFHSHSLRWLVYIQRGLEEGGSMGTGTTSGADWAC